MGEKRDTVARVRGPHRDSDLPRAAARKRLAGPVEP